MKPGTRIELIQPSGVTPESGRIVRTTHQHKPMPGANWHIVKFDADGRTLCVHETRMRVIDNGGPMADLIPFPRLGYTGLQDPQSMADLYQTVSHVSWYRNPPNRCANGMPGHPPCRSPAELEAMLRAQADTTAARESV